MRNVYEAPEMEVGVLETAENVTILSSWVDVDGEIDNDINADRWN